MSQPKRINKSLREVTAIMAGDMIVAERLCIEHIETAATAALKMIGAEEATPLSHRDETA